MRAAFGIGICTWTLCVALTTSVALARECVLAQNETNTGEVKFVVEDHSRSVEFVMNNIDTLWSNLKDELEGNELQPQTILQTILDVKDIGNAVKFHIHTVMSCVSILSEIQDKEIHTKNLSTEAHALASDLKDEIYRHGEYTIYNIRHKFYKHMRIKASLSDQLELLGKWQREEFIIPIDPEEPSTRSSSLMQQRDFDLRDVDRESHIFLDSPLKEFIMKQEELLSFGIQHRSLKEIISSDLDGAYMGAVAGCKQGKMLSGIRGCLTSGHLSGVLNATLTSILAVVRVYSWWQEEEFR